MVEELVYGDYALRGLIKDKWPEAVFEDASDYLHPDRFNVIIKDVPEDDFYIFAIREGFSGQCLRLLLIAGMGDKRVSGWIKKADEDDQVAETPTQV